MVFSAYTYGITLSVCISLHCQFVWNYIADMYGITLPIWPIFMELHYLYERYCTAMYGIVLPICMV